MLTADIQLRLSSTLLNKLRADTGIPLSYEGKFQSEALAHPVTIIGKRKVCMHANVFCEG